MLILFNSHQERGDNSDDVDDVELRRRAAIIVNNAIKSAVTKYTR